MNLIDMTISSSYIVFSLQVMRIISAITLDIDSYVLSKDESESDALNNGRKHQLFSLNSNINPHVDPDLKKNMSELVIGEGQ